MFLHFNLPIELQIPAVGYTRHHLEVVQLSQSENTSNGFVLLLLNQGNTTPVPLSTLSSSVKSSGRSSILATTRLASMKTTSLSWS